MILELIEIFPTGFGPTEAQNFFVFDWEFIVIGNFLTISDGLLRINGDFLLPVDRNNFSITIGLKNKLKNQFGLNSNNFMCFQVSR